MSCWNQSGVTFLDLVSAVHRKRVEDFTLPCFWSPLLNSKWLLFCKKAITWHFFFTFSLSVYFTYHVFQSVPSFQIHVKPDCMFPLQVRGVPVLQTWSRVRLDLLQAVTRPGTACGSHLLLSALPSHHLLLCLVSVTDIHWIPMSW